MLYKNYIFVNNYTVWTNILLLMIQGYNCFFIFKLTRNYKRVAFERIYFLDVTNKYREQCSLARDRTNVSPTLYAHFKNIDLNNRFLNLIDNTLYTFMILIMYKIKRLIITHKIFLFVKHNIIEIKSLGYVYLK